MLFDVPENPKKCPFPREDLDSTYAVIHDSLSPPEFTFLYDRFSRFARLTNVTNKDTQN